MTVEAITSRIAKDFDNLKTSRLSDSVGQKLFRTPGTRNVLDFGFGQRAKKIYPTGTRKYHFRLQWSGIDISAFKGDIHKSPHYLRVNAADCEAHGIMSVINMH